MTTYQDLEHEAASAKSPLVPKAPSEIDEILDAFENQIRADISINRRREKGGTVHLRAGVYMNKLRTKQVILALALEIVGEDLKPDVQLGANAYVYSGEAEGVNKYKATLRAAFRKKLR